MEVSGHVFIQSDPEGFSTCHMLICLSQERVFNSVFITGGPHFPNNTPGANEGARGVSCQSVLRPS